MVYTLNADFNGSDSFTSQATDAGGLFVDGNGAVTVTVEIDAPDAPADSAVLSGSRMLVYILGLH